MAAARVASLSLNLRHHSQLTRVPPAVLPAEGEVLARAPAVPRLRQLHGKQLSIALRPRVAAAASPSPPQQSLASVFAPQLLSAPSVVPQQARVGPSLPVPRPASIPAFPCEKSAIQRIFRSESAAGRQRSFFVCDVGVVERQYGRWRAELPAVRPFYAVKCNPDSALMATLAGCGGGFDAASAAEVELALSLGVSCDDIILANPIKSVHDLQYAARVGVRKMTFDNADELLKVKAHHPSAQLVLRLLPDDSGSVMRFGVKFGAPLVHVEPLLQLASSLGLQVLGCSFHIGSGCFDVTSYAKAIALCRHVFDIAEQRLGMPAFTLLDIGGGFPGNPDVGQDTGAVPAFEKFAAVIRASLQQHFPQPHVRVIAEPGRYMATAFSTLFTHVQGKREEPADPSLPGTRKFLYYMNDGVYGSFNCILFDHAQPVPVPAYRFMTDRLNLDRKGRPGAQPPPAARGLLRRAGRLPGPVLVLPAVRAA